ncbi:MAG: 16S rRNA (uracil(1498)-N(3))-methyltransferase [Proteobacteria bacterium]|nr:16S rRNA (uracil(1498)-N(3))-methyltransferase [Pseudomonadota bacterium]
MPRFHCPVDLHAGLSFDLPAGAARHVQVLRLQPGDELTLFNGEGGEYQATIERMGRSDVAVTVNAHSAVEREVPRAIHLAVGMPANERMDWLVEKATELGVASIQPLMTAHAVLRLAGERADKKRAHWEAIAVAACEQCGRNRVPQVHPVQALSKWLEHESSGARRLVLSLAHGTRSIASTAAPATNEPVLVLSGPEGGLSRDEDELARSAGFAPVTLGARVLRAETAALAALVLLAG